MNTYHGRQIAVILCILAVTFGFALTKLYPAQSAVENTSHPAPAAVYEIRGEGINEGFYYFSSEQQPSGLLKAAGGLYENMHCPPSRMIPPQSKAGRKLFSKKMQAIM